MNAEKEQKVQFGDRVKVVTSLECFPAKPRKILMDRQGQLYVCCKHGRHLLTEYEIKIEKAEAA